MSVSVAHFLEPYETPSFDIVKKLVEDGILHTMDIHYTDKNFENQVKPDCEVIDYSKCNKELYEEYKTELVEEGNWVKIMKHTGASSESKALAAGFKLVKDGKGWSTYRRDWTEEELTSVLVSPRIHKKENCIGWYINNTYDETPAVMVTKTYPDVAFRYIEYCEQDVVFDAVFKDGKCIRNFLEEKEAENTSEKETEDDDFAQYMNKPIC